MKTTIILTEKGKYIYSELSGTVIKKIPEKRCDDAEKFAEDWINSLNFDKILKTRIKAIKKKEPYVFELISKNEAKGVRLVNTRTGIRFELVYIDNVRIKINEILFMSCKDKLESVSLNY